MFDSFQGRFTTHFTVIWPITILKIIFQKRSTSIASNGMTQHTQRPPMACFYPYDNLQQDTWPQCLPGTERRRSATGKWGRRIQSPRWCWINGVAPALRMVFAQRELQEGMQWVDMIVAVVQRISSRLCISGKGAWYITLVWSTVASRALAKGRKRAFMFPVNISSWWRNAAPRIMSTEARCWTLKGHLSEGKNPDLRFARIKRDRSRTISV